MAKTWIDPATGEKRYLRTFTDYNWRNHHLGGLIGIAGCTGMLIFGSAIERLPAFLGIFSAVGMIFCGVVMVRGYLLSRRGSRPRNRKAEALGEAHRRGYF